MIGFPKPEPRKRTKGRKARKEKAVKTTVRQDCVDRDGSCRFFTYREDVYQLVGSCEGRSEWAHLFTKKRAHTRGMPPEVRHDSDYSCQLCTRHHQLYDSGQLHMEAKTAKGANGPIRAWTYDPINGERSCIV